MTFYLSRMGTYQDAHIPPRTIREAVASIEARAEGMFPRTWELLDTYSVVWTPSPLGTVPSGVWLIAATPDTALTTTVRNRIQSGLGVTIPAGSTFIQACRQIATTEATGVGEGRWERLIPRDGMFQLRLGDLVDDWPAG